MVQGGIPFGPFSGETKRNKVGGNSAFNPRILRNLSSASLLKIRSFEIIKSRGIENI